MPDAMVVTPWHDVKQRNRFLEVWGASTRNTPELVLQHDAEGEGCGVTKNRGVVEALRRGAEMVVILDDDCYPTKDVSTLEDLIQWHYEELEPQRVKMFTSITYPHSRGTPYDEDEHDIVMPVAASMGFWTGVGDYCAVRQLAHDCRPMKTGMSACGSVIHGRYFPLSGMNLAFLPRKWAPWCQFIDVPRYDDIWMGLLWQREAYRRGFCFNLDGPVVLHSRQSDVWKNLEAEVRYLEANETLWRRIATHESDDYEDLIRLLPNYGKTS